MNKSLKFLAVACLALSTVGAQARGRIYIGDTKPVCTHTTVIRTEKRDNFLSGVFTGMFLHEHPAVIFTVAAAIVSLGLICAATAPHRPTTYVTVEDDYYDEEVVIIEEREPRQEIYIIR